MGKTEIPSRKLVRENWMSYSSAIERLELYLRFLPIHHERAQLHQERIEHGLPVSPFEFDVRDKPLPDIVPLSGKEWVLYMQSPLMEWEVYWESVYKSIYIMNFIAGYEPLPKARKVYKENQEYFILLEDARHTFAHFVKMLPSIKDYTSRKVLNGMGYTKDGFSFRNRKWSHSSEDTKRFLSICHKFVTAAEIDYKEWVKMAMPPTTQQSQS